MGIFSSLFGGKGSSQGGSYSQVTVPSGLAGLPPYGIHSPGVADAGEAPATDTTHRILNASTATLPTGWSEARSTTATYYNSSGIRSTATSNSLRYDYDPSSLTLRGISLEESRTNLFIHSDDSSCLTGSNASISTSTTNGADGTTKLVQMFPSVNGVNQVFGFQNPTMTSGAVYTYSIDVKQGTRPISIMMGSSTTNVWSAAVFDFSSVSFTQTANGSAGGTILTLHPVVSLPNSIYRLSVTAVMQNANGFIVQFANAATGNTFAASNGILNNLSGIVTTDVIYFGGIMVELGSFPTSHIVTTTASVTRAADVASFTLDAAATDLALSYGDGSVQIYTGVPPGSTFNVPTSSNLRLLYVDDNVAAAGSVGDASGIGTATAVGTGIVTAVGSAAGSGTASGVVVGLSATDKNAAINVSADGLTASLSSTPAGDVEGRGNTAGIANSAFEVVFSGATGGFEGSGIANSTQGLSVYTGSPNGMAYYGSGYYEGPGGISGTTTTYTTGDVITWELLASSAKVYKNGTLQVTFTTLPSDSLYPIVSLRTSGDSATYNFGAKAFSYLPSGDTGWNGLTPLTGNVGAASGSGTATAVGASTAAATGSSGGSATVTAVGASTAASVGSVAGSGTTTAIGASTARSPGSAAGSGAATAVGAATAASVGSSAGSATVTAVGSATARSIGAASGSGTATAVGASTAASVGSSTGSGTATAVAIASAIGSAAGTGSASAVGIASATAVGSVTGSGAATAVGAASAAGVGASTASSTAAAVGESSATSVGASTGSGTATAAGTTTVAAIGSSAGSATAQAYSGILAQAAGSGAASAIGASTASAIGASAGLSTATATSSSTSVSNAVGSAFGNGTASGVGTTAGITTVVSATGLAAGSSTSIGYAPSIDFSDDFGDDFANLQGTLPEQIDFGDDFSDDFAVRHIVRPLTDDFNDDFSNDFAVHHGVQRIVSGVGRAGGASIVSGAISGLKPGDVPTDGEPPPPVYPAPPPPIPLVWHPAQEYRRVQAPRAIRIHRRGTELRKATPRSMKRRYG